MATKTTKKIAKKAPKKALKRTASAGGAGAKKKSLSGTKRMTRPKSKKPAGKKVTLTGTIEE